MVPGGGIPMTGPYFHTGIVSGAFSSLSNTEIEKEKRKRSTASVSPSPPSDTTWDLLRLD